MEEDKEGDDDEEEEEEEDKGVEEETGCLPTQMKLISRKGMQRVACR